MAPSSAPPAADRQPLWWYAGVLRRLRPRGARLLQVECGSGELLRHLADHYEVFGFDVRPRERSRCRMNVPSAVVLEDWETRPDGGCDVVVSIGAFGRRGGRAQVRGLLAALAPGGVLVLIVPNPGGWGRRLKGAVWDARWWADGEALLSKGEWKTLLREQGLRLVAVPGDGLWDPPYVALVPTVLQQAVGDAALAMRSLLPVGWSGGDIGERMILIAERSAA